jgi:hypothetical protein
MGTDFHGVLTVDERNFFTTTPFSHAATLAGVRVPNLVT